MTKSYEIWKKAKGKDTGSAGTKSLENYRRIKSGDRSMLESSAGSAIDRNYINRLTNYAAGAKDRVGGAQEYFDYLNDNEEALRDYMGTGSYDLAFQRLQSEVAGMRKAERGVYPDAPYKGIAPQIAIDVGLRRSGAIAPNAPIKPTYEAGADYIRNLQRRAALVGEQAQLRNMGDGLTLDEVSDYSDRMDEIDLALSMLDRDLNAAGRAQKVDYTEQNAMANADFEKMSQQGAQMNKDATAQWRLVNTPQSMRDETLRQASMLGERQALRTAAGQEAYDHMTSEERNVFNYLYATQGNEAANAYLEDLRSFLSTRRAQAEVKESQKLAKEHPLGANLMSVVGTLEGGLAYAESALGKALGQEIDTTDPLYDIARMRSTVREATGENIKAAINNEFLGEAAAFGYQTAMSMADSLMAAGLSALTFGGAGATTLAGSAGATTLAGSAGATTLAGSAANDTMMQAKERGASDDQALVLGGLAGVAEALFEKIPIENFLKKADPGVRGAWVLNVLRQMGIEASEESSTEVANIIAESLVMGDQSQYAGMSAGEIAGQVALAGLGGAISGGAMGGIAVGMNAIGNKIMGVKPEADPLRAAAMDVAAQQQEQETPVAQQSTQPAQETAQAVADEGEEDYTLPEANAPAVAQTRTDAAVDMRTDETVEIEGIDSVEDGTVYVLAGVEKIPAADLQFSDPQTAALYDAASELDTATAQRFVAGYEGGDVQQYIQSFTSVYKDGQAGIPYETTLKQRISAQNLTEQQRLDAYAGGVASNKPTINAAKLKPGLTRSYTKASLSREAAASLKKHRRQIEAIDVMAKKYGRKVVLVSSLEGMTINGETITSAVNGAYDRSSDTIYIAADAQDGAFAYVAMHEMVHSIRKDSAENYNRLRDTVFEALEASGEDIDALTKYQMEKFGYDEDSAIEEVIANTAPTVLTDKQFVHNLYANDRSLFDKIKAFIDDLKKVFDQLTQSGSWAQDAALNEESVRKIAEVFDEVARGDLSQEGRVKLSVRDSLMGDLSSQKTFSYENLVKQPPMNVLRTPALEARIRELEQQVKDERAAGQINAAVERRAGRQAVQEARTAERMVEGRIRSEERQRAAERLEAQKQRDAEKLREVREQRDQKRKQDLREQRETINAQRKERDEQTKYRERIMANVKTLTAWLTRPTDEKHVPESMRKTIAKFLETLEWGDGTKRTKKGDLWRSRLTDMLLVMERIDKSADEGQVLDIDPDLTARMEEFLGGVPDTITSIGNLNTEQLRDLDYILQTVKRTVVYANRTRANKLYASVSAIGDATITEMDLAKGKSKFWQTFSGADKFFNIQQLDSFGFFAGLGEAAESVLYELRDGFDAKIKHVQQAVEFVKPFTDGLKMREISGKQAKLHTFQLNDGEVKMTTAQIMELYELLKREQARGHIFGSGIRIADISRGKLSADVKQINPVQITVEEAQTIVERLSDKQKQLADRLAWFMGNECAAWGNETSVLMYGYKKFTEQNYYPIHSDSNFILTSDKNDKGQQGAFAALKNLGMTKQVQQGAHNSIIIGDIFDTFTQHVDDMASYNGMMPALSDAMKWYNFKAENEMGKVKSVKRSMERRAGIHAKGYFETLIKQLNGVNDRGERIGITNWLTSHAKAAAVGANLRVVLQQPTAYIRAAAVIDPKYLLEGLGKAFAKGNRAMAKEYSPIALWKSWGYYDISIGKDMRSLLFNDSNVDEKLREWSMAPAAFADEMTWGALFRACLAEQEDIHPNWSEEQKKVAAGRRLNEIVDLTQVVDSPFHKSQLMRSSDGLVRMQTSFMAEPTKNYNLLRTSLVKAIEKKDKASIRQFGRTAVSWLVSATVAAAFAAIADAGRDDDDTKNLLEKYGEALGANLIDNVNLLNSIPFVKDILSQLEGYEPSRLDMQAADKLINVGKVWLKQLNAEKGEKPYTHWYMAYQTAQAVSSITGIPVGNLMREVDAIASAFGADLKTKTSIASATERYEKLYGAIVEGKDNKVQRIEAALKEDEKSPKDIDSGIAKVLAEQDERIAEAYEAREDGDIETLDEIRDELAELFGEETVDKALNLYENGAEKQPTEKNLNEELSAPLFDYADMEVVALQAFETGDTDALVRVIEEIKADSDAQDPDSAVRTKATTLFKPVYLKAKSRGYTKQAARIKKILIEVFGMKEENIDKWKEK